MATKKILLFAIIVSAMILHLASAFTWTDGNLLGYYQVNEISGTNAPNLGTVGVSNFTLSNGVAWNLTTSKLGYAITCDGVNDRGNADYTALTGIPSLTISFWVYPNNLSASEITRGQGSARTSWVVDMNASGSLGYTVDNGAGTVTFRTPRPIALRNWTHVVAMYNASQVSLYLNNTFIGQTGLTGNVYSTNIQASLCYNNNGNSLFFNGTIDEIGFWNRSFTTNDIAEMYNIGFGLPYNNDYLNVSLISPLNGSTISSSLDLTINGTVQTGTMNTATLFLYYPNGTLLSQSKSFTGSFVNQTNFSFTPDAIGQYLWNVRIVGTNATGTVGTLTQFSPANRTFVYGYSVNSETWSNISSELATQMFSLNITIPSGLISSQATLVYNNSRILGTTTSNGNNRLFSKTITTPDVASEQNISFYWELALTDSSGISYFNTTTHNQTVKPISLDNCTSNSLLVLNYTLKDEDSRVTLTTNQNLSMQVSVIISAIGNISANTTFSQTYNATNPARVCITSEILNQTTFRLDAVNQYSSDSRVIEFHNLQNVTLNNNTIPNRIDLYDLAITSSQEFVITYKDNNFIPVEGAIIEILRNYIGLGQSLPVEVPKTDIDGKTIGHFVLGDVIYTITVKKEGVLLATFTNVRVVCQDITTGNCRIPLNSLSSSVSISSFLTRNNISYYPSYNISSRTLSVLFSTTDGRSRYFVLNGTLFNTYLNQSVCSQDVTTSSGTLTCVVPQSYENGTAIFKFYADGEPIFNQIMNIASDNSNEPNERYILAFLLIICLGAMGLLGGPIITLIVFLIGIVIAVRLLLINVGGYVGPLSAFMFFVIGAIIIIYKASREERYG